MLRAEPHSKIGDRNAMTKEEIVVLKSVYATGIYDAGYDVQKESRKALDALEEAHREIARLEKLALIGDSGYCAGCERVFPSAEINFTDEQDYCSPCLTEATKPRRAAVTVHVQGEGESVEAFLARCDAESTT